jgi:hypothetical protein
MLGAFTVGQMELPLGRTISGVEIPDEIDIALEFPMVLNDAGVIGYSLNGKSFPATEPVRAGRGRVDAHALHERGPPGAPDAPPRGAPAGRRP